VLGQGSGHHGGGLVLGHFAAERWQPAGSDDVYVHELMIGGKGLRRGAPEVFATLLRGAAHALARVRGIQDTSRQGRYHNKRFKQLGEELGLVIARDPRIGSSLTTAPVGDRRALRGGDRHARPRRRAAHRSSIWSSRLLIASRCLADGWSKLASPTCPPARTAVRDRDWATALNGLTSYLARVEEHAREHNLTPAQFQLALALAVIQYGAFCW
jgi:hypothetical protein